MKKIFILAVLTFSQLASAHTGECLLKTKGFTCRADVFGPCEPIIKKTLDRIFVQVQTAEECLKLARTKKLFYSNLPVNQGTKIIFTKVKINFKSQNETLKAELK